MDPRVELEAIGVEPAIAETLSAMLANAAGMLDPDDPAETRHQLLLHVAIVATRDTRRLGSALRLVTDWLAPSLSEMSAYDVGRYWHVRGLLSLRVDGAVSAATRALNASMRTLLLDGSPRAKRYLARVHDTFGQLLHQQGLLTDALLELKRSLALRDPSDRFGMAITHGNLGRLCMDLGDFRAAVEHFTRDLELVDQLGNVPQGIRAQLLSHLGHCQLQVGALELAQHSYEQSQQLAATCGDVFAGAFATLGLGRVALRRGDAVRARHASDSVAAQLATVNATQQLRAAAQQLAGDAQLAAGMLDDAVQNYIATLAHLDADTGSSPMEYATAHRALSQALGAQGKPAESARHLRLALRHLDGTAAVELRREVETELQRSSSDSWLLHSAGRFVGQQHIELLLDEAGKPGFRGETRRVVVLFSDIRGFTSIAERLSASQVIEFLNDYLTHMTRSIERHGGLVDKFIGDAVMAVFPLDERGGKNAIDAALAMRDELERFNRSLPADFSELSIGIGIHGGDVIAGLIGSPQKREYTVIGDVVNTASRLEGMTKQLGATTLASSAVLTEQVRQRYLLRPLGRLTPKGRARAIEVFDVVGERDRSSAALAMAAEIARVEDALGLLAARDLARAAASFEALERATATTPRAAGYAFMARKVRALAAAPLDGEWGGEIVLDEK